MYFWKYRHLIEIKYITLMYNRVAIFHKKKVCRPNLSEIYGSFHDFFSNVGGYYNIAYAALKFHYIWKS